MIGFKQYIKEVLDSPLKFEKSEKQISYGKTITYTATTPKDDDLKIRIFPHRQLPASYKPFETDKKISYYEIAFYINNSTNITNRGEQNVVLSTVKYAVKDFVDTVHPQVIFFTSDTKEKSRTRLYTSFIKLLASYIGYESFIKKINDNVIFYVYTKDLKDEPFNIKELIEEEIHVREDYLMNFESSIKGFILMVSPEHIDELLKHPKEVQEYILKKLEYNTKPYYIKIDDKQSKDAKKILSTFFPNEKIIEKDDMVGVIIK